MGVEVGRSTVLRAEDGGAISAANVRKLAAALGISVHQLLHEEPGHTQLAGAA
jgi:hypothetical protein